MSFGYDEAGRLTSMRDVNDRVVAIERDAGGRAVKLVSPDGLATDIAYAADGWISKVTNPASEATQLTLDSQGLLKKMIDAAGRVHAFEYDNSGRLTKDTESSGSYQTLSRSEDKSSVTRTTARGLSYVYTRKPDPEGGEQLTVTLPDGLKVQNTSTAGHSVTKQQDGRTAEAEYASDPRFGLSAKYPSRSTFTTPSGLKAEITSTRKIELKDTNDPTSLKSFASTVKLNNNVVSGEQYDPATRTRTETLVGSTYITKLDERGRVIEYDPPAVKPITVSYNAAGRVLSVTQGDRVLSTLDSTLAIF
jgi:YD repeat-containing protein